jgi:prefoldin subunit 5
MAEIMENQESAIESLKNEAQKTSSNETKELKASLDEKSSEIIDLKKKIQDITKRVT